MSRWSGHYRLLCPTPHQIQASINSAVILSAVTSPKQGAKRGILHKVATIASAPTFLVFFYSLWYILCRGLCPLSKQIWVPFFLKASDNCCSRSCEKTSTCLTKYLEKCWYKCKCKLRSTRQQKRAYCSSSWFRGALCTWIVPSACNTQVTSEDKHRNCCDQTA